MTWAGEDPGSGIYMFTEDGTPNSIALGSDGQVLAMSGSLPAFVDPDISPASGHSLLSSTHTDTIPHVVTSGDLIVGSGGFWYALPIGPTEYNLTVTSSGMIDWEPPRGGLSNASGNDVGTALHAFSAIEASTTDRSASGSVMPGMEIVPGSGSYLCVWSATVASSRSSSEIEIALFANNVGASGTLREVQFPSANLKITAATNGIVSVLDGQSISIRWRISSGPTSTVATVYGRDLSILRVNDKTVIGGE